MVIYILVLPQRNDNFPIFSILMLVCQSNSSCCFRTGRKGSGHGTQWNPYSKMVITPTNFWVLGVWPHKYLIFPQELHSSKARRGSKAAGLGEIPGTALHILAPLPPGALEVDHSLDHFILLHPYALHDCRIYYLYWSVPIIFLPGLYTLYPLDTLSVGYSIH